MPKSSPIRLDAVPPSIETLSKWDIEAPEVIPAIAATGEILSLEILGKTISELTHVLGIKVRNGALQDLQWNPDAITRAVSLARMFERVAEQESTPEFDRIESLNLARKAIQWGMPEAALLYIAFHLNQSAGWDSATSEAIKLVAKMLEDYASGKCLPRGTSLTYAGYGFAST
jgi:hypothetical protein